jgi:hypothetical protein
MSDEEAYITEAPTSPELDVNTGIVKSTRDFSGSLTLDLTDDEIARAYRIVVSVKTKWQEIFRRKFNDPSSFSLDKAMQMVEHFEDEIKTELAEKVGILATVNTVPLLEGQPLEIDWIGKIPGGDLDRYGFDHERKGWEVKRATERGEDFLGQHDG